MKTEHTLLIIKPNAVAKNIIGAICHRLESANFKIVGIKMLQLTKCQAEGFYKEHKSRLFFNLLINSMISGPIVVSVLKGDNAINRFRDLIGATDPNKALKGTLRADYGDSLTENAIHGSDSVESAIREINYFFASNEIYKPTY